MMICHVSSVDVENAHLQKKEPTSSLPLLEAMAAFYIIQLRDPSIKSDAVRYKEILDKAIEFLNSATRINIASKASWLCKVVQYWATEDIANVALCISQTAVLHTEHEKAKFPKMFWQNVASDICRV